MTLTYEQETHAKYLEAVVDEYTDWFMRVTRRVFYPDSITGAAKEILLPASFNKWMRVAETQKLIEEGVLGGLDRIHKDLTHGADQMMEETAKFEKPPAFKDFDQLAMFFEEFVNTLRRISKDYQVGGKEIDTLTGLRTREMFYKDIRREMDRLARQGKPFCIALLKIDNYDDFKKHSVTHEFDGCLKMIGDAIKKCVRSFDDAYRMDNDTFVLALKQTSVGGGMKALYRLKQDMQKEKITYALKGINCDLTMMSCIAEPVPEDDARQLLSNMEKDLLKHAGQHGAVIEYHDVSPLQRFINEGK